MTIDDMFIKRHMSLYEINVLNKPYMANINKIRLSGQTYDIQDPNAQPLLTAGQGISIENNVISATGGGGGKAINAGRGISVTTGETADTINCTLPISAGTNGHGIILNTGSTAAYDAIASGYKANAAQNGIAFGYSSYTNTTDSIVVGQYNKIDGNGNSRFALGASNIISTYGRGALGVNLISNAMSEVSCGQYNISRGNNFNFGNSGDTVFTIGNGNFSARHNAFEVRQNGDIYIADTNDTSTTNYYQKPMIKLQDALGGGGSSYTAGDGIDITNDVISVTGKVDTSAITTSISSSSTDSQVPSAKAVNDQLGGMKIVKLTESEYTALVTKDSNTLYVVVPDPSN